MQESRNTKLREVRENSIKEFLTSLNLSDYLKIFDTRSRPKFEINDENEKLLAAFKETNMIGNYEESSEKKGYYKSARPKLVIKALPRSEIYIPLGAERKMKVPCNTHGTFITCYEKSLLSLKCESNIS